MNRTQSLTLALLALGVAATPLLASAQEMRPNVIPKETRAIVRDTRFASSTAPKPGSMPLGERAASSTMPRPRLEPRTASSTVGTMMREQERSQKVIKAKERADQEIDRRITSLEAFAARIGNARISDADKSSLKTSMQEQVDMLTALKGQIASDTSTSSMKEAVKSITESHRIYMLVIPRGAIVAAADRVNQVASQMQLLSAKLATRVNATPTASSTPALLTSLADLDAKVADAMTLAKDAVTLVTGLAPDNGDKTVAQTNKTALQDAHKKIEAAQKSLQTARKDAETIVKALRKSEPKAPRTSSETGTTTERR